MPIEEPADSPIGPLNTLDPICCNHYIWLSYMNIYITTIIPRLACFDKTNFCGATKIGLAKTGYPSPHSYNRSADKTTIQELCKNAPGLTKGLSATPYTSSLDLQHTPLQKPMHKCPRYCRSVVEVSYPYAQRASITPIKESAFYTLTLKQAYETHWIPFAAITS